MKEAKEQEIIIYEFHFPVELCGRLIGRQGVHVDYIRQMTQVDLVVRDDAVSFEKQVVALHGWISFYCFELKENFYLLKVVVLMLNKQLI